MSLLKFDELDIKREVDSKYLAHIRKDGVETLKAHIDLVYDYFLELVKQNGLEKQLNTLFEQSVELILEEDEILSDKDGFTNFVKYLFAKAVYWHDMGKVNPNFQAHEDKMDNNTFKKINGLSEKSNHSPLGAYLFINHSLQELYGENDGKNWDEDEIEIIESIIYLFGYFISKHHGSIYQSSDFEFNDDLEQFLKLFQIEKSFTKVHKDENRVFSTVYDYIEDNKDTLFLLSKSLFSLLIISDYYATAQFMNYGNRDDLVYNDFGLIDEKFRAKIYDECYIDKFDENGKQKTFNQLLQNKENNHFKDFSELQDKSNDNLNHLRNKLFVEVRTNLKETLEKNENQNLFYIEAPTGAGKTNLSVMSAVEILKQDTSINKIFYVFPFTTLITQTYDFVKNILDLDNSEIVQLHSKAKYNEGGKDGVYGDEKSNFLDNQFMNYPITLLSHVRFFNVLTGVSKDDNYIFHRLANSIVIIDEIQTYSPDLWSKIVYMLDSFAEKFNIKFIVMSATLPKIGDIIDSEFTFLVSNKQKYFQNPNFAGRVTIDEKSLKKPIKIKEPKVIYPTVLKESKAYQKISKNKKVKTIIEFITKKGADGFYQEAVGKNKNFFDEIFILSGTVLEPRRREIINFLNNENNKNVLLVTTQVVEAGVDIDMDIGFKERSLVDSDEQLAGRINRNSSKEGNKLFLFEMENPKAKFVYRGDKRLGVEELNVLNTKDFDDYYNQVLQKLKVINNSDFIENLNSYKDHIKNLRFSEAHIKIIDMESVSVFVPWCDEAVEVWQKYKELVQNKELDFTKKKIELKTLASEISKYTFSLAKYQGSGIENLLPYCRDSKESYGYLYLEEYESIYSYNNGLDTKVLGKGGNVGMFI
ncbi:MAG: CRISPR-associated helicase Cas3 [uncultured Sulfurovum sp.]|uniref:CRISPR-associated helicase Cas3 n=1 Tax=uncultured Sulfurovum sp. TaxID=269237 RepID=A0A6S6TN02_9BACT|nr:MAG: CRISPR-associated helicase Cas3 [uncultured Sulfurovum sp.]